MVRGSVPCDQAAVSGVPPARALASGSNSPLPPLAAAGADGARPVDRGRHGQRAWRRRRDPGRPRAQAAALLRQGERRRMARRDAPGPPEGPAHDGDDDVRDRGDRRRADRAPGAPSRAAGRDQAASPRSSRGATSPITPSWPAAKRPASTTCAPSRSPASSSTTSRACRRPG